MRRSQLSRAHVVAATLASILLVVLFMVNNTWGVQLRFLWRTRVLSTYEPGCVRSVLPIVQSQPPDAPIPPIVHYVWLLNGREHFSLDFKVFISVYSTSLYFETDIIYIHTDATPEQWEHAKAHGDDATRWTLAVAKVTHSQVTPRNSTLSCTQILKVQHKSDFVRTEQLYKHGGIYMDTDVIPLRDVKQLRESGWRNIMGIEGKGRVNNGFVMSQPGSALTSILMSEQHQKFDNRWTTHSVELLADLAYRLQPVPMEVLILGIRAFSPSSWRKDNIKALFGSHIETSPSTPKETQSLDEQGLPKIPTTFEDAVEYWNRTKSRDRPNWEIDYSGSYVIHAFDVHGRGRQNVDLEYVMARQSNYARAVYPAVEHAIRTGKIEWRPADDSR